MSSNTFTGYEGQRDHQLQDSCFPADPDLLEERGGGEKTASLVWLIKSVTQLSLYIGYLCGRVHLVPGGFHKDI